MHIEPPFSNSAAILSEVQKENQYVELIHQLNRDFNRAGVSIHFEETISPSLLKNQLQKTISHLIQKSFSNYLNLLYIIDVSEQQLKTLKKTNEIEWTEHICFLILKREWQKVAFRKTL